MAALRPLLRNGPRQVAIARGLALTSAKTSFDFAGGGLRNALDPRNEMPRFSGSLIRHPGVHPS